ncbi:MAG: biotin--[acetyl-CoA-carboxylase] ligase [Firmicutes bacterium]|nr:biotin--[acetyl-CoA-carboxylase] ligase [Bacillota bacterium]
MTLRTDLLQLLKNNGDHYISGEQICRQLGVSRTAVWKHMEALRKMDYVIEARSNAGYRLVSVPDRLYPEEVQTDLETSVMGSEVRYSAGVVSTNENAKEWAREGAPDGAVYIAEEQGVGKGRLGRGWFSPRGRGLWFSIVVRPQINPVDVPQITLVAAVAVAAAINEQTGLVPGIKWPNDLLAGKGKLCGILTEMNADMERIQHIVIGIGLNVNIYQEDIPRELQGVITSIAMETGRKINRVQLLQAILRQMDCWYQIWISSGFNAILEKWKQWNVTLGQRVQVSTLKEVVEGVAEDVDETGALVVRLNDGNCKRFLAGEVSLRGKK